MSGGTENTKLNVEGPLPIPSLTVGYEREWLSVSPLSLYYWDSLGLEPWAASRDVAYIVLAPDNDLDLPQGSH